VGRAFRGAFAQVRPDDLGAHALRAALARAPGVAAESIDDVILGCAFPEAEQGLDVGRYAALLAGLPPGVPAMTVNRFCASGLQSVAQAAERIEAGRAEAVLAGGLESMSLVPMTGHVFRPNPALAARMPEAYIGMGLTAERVAERFKVSRADQDAFALRSHQRAVEAQRAGRFDDEIAPMTVPAGPPARGRTQAAVRRVTADEGPRADTTAAALAALRPAFKAGGSVTAGNSSQTSDAAAAVLVMSEARAGKVGLKPAARLLAYAVAGVPPDIMGIGPVVAVPKALAQAGLRVADIDLWELNEAFAAQALYCARELGIPDERLNVNGGAIALGHPLGATGARLTATLLHELRRRGVRGAAGLVAEPGHRRAVSGVMEERIWQRHYDDGVPRSIDYAPLTLTEGLRRAARTWPDAPAVIFRGRTLSYARLVAQVDALAAHLRATGLQPGERVAVQLPNLPQSIVAFHGVLAAGGAVVQTNPLYSDDELVGQWSDAGCAAAIVGGWLWAERLATLRGHLPVRHWISTSLVDGLPAWMRPLARRRMALGQPELLREPSGAVRWHAALAQGRALAAPAGPAPQDVAVVQYTGGTTGRSKGALLTHRNLSSNVQQMRAWMRDLRPGCETFLAALPYFHVFGLTVCMNLPLWVGAAIVVQPDPRDTQALLDLIERQRVTVLALVPTMAQAIVGFPGIETRRLRSLRLCLSGSAPLPVDTLGRFEELTGARLFEGYGLTETSPLTHCNPLYGLRKTGSIGVPVPDTDARLLDPSDATREVAPGEVGELAVRGPQVMAGYWQRPEETAAVLRDGWFLTGDLATCDDDGYFRIVGRKKEMIIVGGYKVYPDDVDRVLASHPAVAESATIGVPHPRLGEIVKSFVVLRPGATATEAELAAHCRQHLAAFKVPREIELRASLPRSAVLKVLRRELLREELERRAARGESGGQAAPSRG
jgi:long-chain acyl-CoA synthetase